MEPLDPELRRIVHEGMIEAVPGRAVRTRVLNGLRAQLAEPGPAPARADAPAPPPARGTSKWGRAGTSTASTKTLLWVVLGGATLAAGWWLGGSPRPPSSVAAPAEAPAPREAEAKRSSSPSWSEGTPAVTEPPPADREPATSPPDAVGSPAPPRRSPGEAPTARREPTGPEVTPATPDELAAEIEQIAAADRALAGGDARGALAHAREHALAHPHGQLVLERRALELAARCSLREPGASEAARAFEREHGEAPAAAKVRAHCSTPETTSSAR